MSGHLTIFLTVCLVSVCLSVRSTHDYLQPYKFVKPLESLSDLYSEPEETEENLPIVQIAQSRSGEALPLIEEDKEEKVEDNKSLMSDEMFPPDLTESLPEALPQKKSRSRKKVEESEDEETTKDKKEDRIGNHQSVDNEEGKEKDTGPKAEAFKGRPKAYYDDDEYYYDDDEYYEYYEDYEEYEEENKAPIQKPVGRTSHPKYTQTKHNKKEDNKPTRATKTVTKSSKPTSSYTSKYNSHSSKPYSSSSNKSIQSSKSKPSSSYSKPMSYSKSSYTKQKPKSSKKDYSISNTLERLQMIKKHQLKRAGYPSLPNPWQKINKYKPSKSPPKSSIYNRKKTDNRKYQSKPKSPSKSPRPVKPYSDYYEDDYYYDYEEPRNIARQGYGVFGKSAPSNPLALLIAPLAGIALLTAAAAVAINPVLVTVSITGKRRRRRDADEGLSPEMEEKIHEMEVLEKFMSTVPESTGYQQQVMSMYLSCSGYTEITNTCLDRVVCEYANTNSTVGQAERDIISIVLYNIMANDYVSDEYKDRLRVAARSGRDSQNCQVFECSSITDVSTNNL